MWRYVMGGTLPYMTSAPNQDVNWIDFLILEIFSKEKKITFLAQICFFFPAGAGVSSADVRGGPATGAHDAEGQHCAATLG
jgi:hypothetical protein